MLWFLIDVSYALTFLPPPLPKPPVDGSPRKEQFAIDKQGKVLRLVYEKEKGLSFQPIDSGPTYPKLIKGSVGHDFWIGLTDKKNVVRYRYFPELSSTFTPDEATKEIPGFDDIVDIRAGHDHFIALTNKGTVLEWDASIPTKEVAPCPRMLPELKDIVALSAGYRHNLALDKRGNAWEWLADGVAVPRKIQTPHVVSIMGLNDQSIITDRNGKHISLNLPVEKTDSILTKIPMDPVIVTDCKATDFLGSFKSSFKNYALSRGNGFFSLRMGEQIKVSGVYRISELHVSNNYYVKRERRFLEVIDVPNVHALFDEVPFCDKYLLNQKTGSR